MRRIDALPLAGFQDSSARVTSHGDRAPLIELGHLDALWFQVTGTLCNLACTHCFISCAPTNRSFDLMALEEVERRLEESVALGVREYYFTGGEPFLHPHIVAILSRALEYGPATVLTNGTLLGERHVAPLATVAADSRYSLEFRLSLDGFEAASHDAIRGAGTFDAALAGLGLLLTHGFLPIVTAVRTWDAADEASVLRALVERLRQAGYAHPRIKLLPALRIGAEAERSRGYLPSERVTTGMLAGFDADRLLCSASRIVTSRGVWVCPILLDEAAGRLGDDLPAAAGRAFPLRHGACHTCWEHGAMCANPGAFAPEAGTATGGLE